MKTAVKIPLIESELGWGRKIDDYMVCLTVEDALTFQKEFNSENTSVEVPDYYLVIEGEPEPFSISESQYEFLTENNRVWLSFLKHK